ncbi:MAG: ribosome biogenesis factor YjgA [Pseudohongiellaceae bacterium]
MTDDANNDDQQVSKSQRKREMHALQNLGRQLTEINDSLLDKLTLPDELKHAIAEYKRLPNKHEARRRQMQFIGRLMRDVDATEIEQILDQSRLNVEQEKRKFHQLELLRDELLQENSKTLEHLISEYPTIDIQHLRQLVRQSQKQLAEHKPPAASRKLFRYLRDIILSGTAD